MTRAREGLCAPKLVCFPTYMTQLSKNLLPLSPSLASLPCAEKGERGPSRACSRGEEQRLERGGASVLWSEVCLPPGQGNRRAPCPVQLEIPRRSGGMCFTMGWAAAGV